jgi:hypothetical protein
MLYDVQCTIITGLIHFLPGHYLLAASWFIFTHKLQDPKPRKKLKAYS